MKKIFIFGGLALTICIVISVILGYFGYTEFVEKPELAAEFNDSLIELQLEAINRTGSLDEELAAIESQNQILSAVDAYKLDILEIENRVNEIELVENSENLKSSILNYIVGLKEGREKYYVDELSQIIFNTGVSEEEFNAEVTRAQDEFLEIITQLELELAEAQQIFADESGFQLGE